MHNNQSLFQVQGTGYEAAKIDLSATQIDSFLARVAGSQEVCPGGTGAPEFYNCVYYIILRKKN